MAMIKCPECGNDMSDAAKSCPKCGFVLKKKGNKAILISIIICVLLVAGIGGFFAIKYFGGNSDGGSENSSDTIVETERIKLQRTAYNDIDKAISKLKNSLKNDSSLDIKGISIGYLIEDKKPYSVTIKYSATNSFGGVVTDYCTYYTSIAVNPGELEFGGYCYANYDAATNEKGDKRKVYDDVWSNGTQYYFLVDLDVMNKEK